MLKRTTRILMEIFPIVFIISGAGYILTGGYGAIWKVNKDTSATLQLLALFVAAIVINLLFGKKRS